ncbi:MAG TPA: uroporphyrinogen-III C-methyltransferase [Gammaproteobacteria bacterium]|nr:uroporphyrinogen-III C-methyltransferase [Gammaproteobacteria bacterium]
MSEPETPSEPSSAPRSAASDASDADWTELAASLAAQKSGRPALPREPAPPAPPPPPSGLNRAVFTSSLALALAVISIAVAGMLWWQYREFYVSLDQTDNVTAASLERMRAEQRSLQDSLEDAKDDLATLRQQNAVVTERVDALPSRFSDFERRLDAVQGGSFDARANLLRSEAEYYLNVANTELALTADWDNAITALQLADGRLAELADPQLAPVREAIAGELLAVRSVRLPDVEGLVFSLGRLAARADDLPLRADPPANFKDSAAQLDDAEPGLERMWRALKSTLLGIVRIERRDTPVEQALSAAERMLARRQLELELTVAQTAVLRSQPQAFKASVGAAIDLVQRDFDVKTADVDGALALLKEMREVEVEPRRPDISGSLGLLRKIQNGDR